MRLAATGKLKHLRSDSDSETESTKSARRKRRTTLEQALRADSVFADQQRHKLLLFEQQLALDRQHSEQQLALDRQRFDEGKERWKAEFELKQQELALRRSEFEHQQQLQLQELQLRREEQRLQQQQMELMLSLVSSLKESKH